MDTKVLIKVGGVSRLPWIDWAKAICMFCVILTHTHCFRGVRILNYFDIPALLYYIMKRIASKLFPRLYLFIAKKKEELELVYKEYLELKEQNQCITV